MTSAPEVSMIASVRVRADKPLRLEKNNREGSIVKKLSISTGLVVVCAVALVAGCATTPPEDLIKAQMAAFKAGIVAQNIDAIMAPFSEAFEHYEWGDKAGAKDFMNQAIDMGYLEGVEVNIDDAQVTVDGDKATAEPIEISGSFGSITVELAFTKEEGGWMITGLDASGI